CAKHVRVDLPPRSQRRTTDRRLGRHHHDRTSPRVPGRVQKEAVAKQLVQSSTKRRGSPVTRIINITRKGRRAAKRLGGMHALVVELAARAKNITPEHLAELGSQLLDHYGDADKAADALRKGEVILKKMPPPH